MTGCYRGSAERARGCYLRISVQRRGRAAAQTDSDPTISRLTQMQSLEWSRGTQGTNKGRKVTRDVVAVGRQPTRAVLTETAHADGMADFWSMALQQCTVYGAYRYCTWIMHFAHSRGLTRDHGGGAATATKYTHSSHCGRLAKTGHASPNAMACRPSLVRVLRTVRSQGGPPETRGDVAPLVDLGEPVAAGRARAWGVCFPSLPFPHRCRRSCGARM